MSVRDFPHRPTDVVVDSDDLLRWLDALGECQNIDLHIEATPALDDEFDIFDKSAGKRRKVNFTAVQTLIGGGGGGGSPGSPDTSIQFNSAGSFAGSADFTFDTGSSPPFLYLNGDLEIDHELYILSTGDIYSEGPLEVHNTTLLDGDVTVTGTVAITGAQTNIGAVNITGAQTNIGALEVTAERYAVRTEVDLTTGATIADAAGVYIVANGVSGGGTITNNYGLYIEDQTTGTTDNWAIKTGASKVEFGGKTTVGPLQGALPGNLTSYFGSDIQAVVCSSARMHGLGVAVSRIGAAARGLFVATEGTNNYGAEIDCWISANSGFSEGIEINNYNDGHTGSTQKGIVITQSVYASGTATEMTGIDIDRAYIIGGTATTVTGINIDAQSPATNGGAITTAIGINIGDQTATGVTNAWAIKTGTGRVQFGATVETGIYTVATLPTGVKAMRAFVTDATATTFASIVAGGAANNVPVYYDGTNWRIG